MSEQLVWSVGNRSPSITENITDSDGNPVDLSASTVQFRMRAVGSETLKVDAAATITDAPGGLVRYDWAALDVDTPGFYLVWWVVTTAGKTQDVSEALIEFREHGLASPPAYLELVEAKATLELVGGHADADIEGALLSASRTLEEMCDTRWYTTALDEIRYYTPEQPHRLWTDEIVELTELATDDSGGTSYASVWTENTDFVLAPLNATVDGRPFTNIQTTARTSRYFRSCYPRSVRLTGKFGWAQTPQGIKDATALLATRFLRRKREAPFGIVSIGLDGNAVRISRFDPELEQMLAPYNRSVPVA
jgi:hypothetical protein